MSMKKLELWLDESGDFNNDSNISKNPSLVGGILVEKGRLDLPTVTSILGSEYIHSNEINKKHFGTYAVKVLSDVVKNYGHLVIFENQERLEIVDGNTTYLNVLAEGIIQLLQLLSAQYGYIELDVLIAVRLDMQKQNLRLGTIIKSEEYTLRLKEKIIIGLARRTLSNNKNWSWNIKMASAKKDSRLMLADVACNSFLTKTSKKFNDEQRQQLELLFNERYCFTVFEKSTKGHIKRLIADGAIGAAIFEIYTSEESLNKKELIEIVLDRMSMLNEEGISLQLINIKMQIDALIKIDNDYEKSKKLLLSMQEELIPLLVKNNINVGTFALDIALYLLTVYTHEGSIVFADQQMHLCKSEIKKLKNRWESVDYFFMLKIRQAVHQINAFDYKLAIENMDVVINALEETIGLFPLVHGLGELYKDIKSDLIGKALGTRLQARRFLIRNDSTQLQEAYKDSDRAILEFMNDSDTIRQYQYRCEIECEGGNYLGAVNYLCKSLGLTYEEEDIMSKLMNNIIIDKQSPLKQYSLMHYVRIMAEAAVGQEHILSDSMFAAWNKLQVGKNDIIINPANDHPHEIVLWKLGTYMSQTGNITAAIKYYNEAINICNSMPHRLTLKAIGLGIMAEKASVVGHQGNKYLKEFNIALKNFINTYNKFMEIELPLSMYELFKSWESSIEELTKTIEVTEKTKLLWKLSREITY